MALFRRFTEPTARETFLVAALALTGITTDMIATAEKAGDQKFLAELLKDDAELTAAQTARDHANAALKLELKAREEFYSRIAGAGYKPEDYASAEAFQKATKTMVDKRASELAADISASRGITPVTQAPADATTGDANAADLAEQFEKMKAGPERTAFFAKHKAAILSASRN
jgi:hypothetical protein